jgi:hypothetical protein
MLLAADGPIVSHNLRVLEKFHYLRFIVQHRDGLGIKLLRRNILEGVALPSFFINAPVDNRELARSNHLVNVVKVVEGVPLKLTQALDVAFQLRPALEVEKKTRVVIITV